ncbi:hypothetical protein [uncultured Brachyspira sp.]|uniref:hypothetical protein n=1 Tax=uncultured Brachyspira sp. TaxID=221953 RepID=UPI0027DAF297|nr:hypothetical protein [uncultured Brachyspira sp.]
MKDKKIVSPIYLAKPKNEWFSEYDSVENREVLGGYKDMETLLKNSISINHDNTKIETKNNNSTNEQMEEKMIIYLKPIKKDKPMLEALNDESLEGIDLKPLEDSSNDFNDNEENKNSYEEEKSNNSFNSEKKRGFARQNDTNNDKVKIISVIAKNTKEIYRNISEAYKENLKAEQNKDNNTFDFGKELIDNGNTEEGINFVKSERDKDRKYRIITKVCDTVEKNSIVGMFIYLIFCKKTNKNNNSSKN